MRACSRKVVIYRIVFFLKKTRSVRAKGIDSMSNSIALLADRFWSGRLVQWLQLRIDFRFVFESEVEFDFNMISRYSGSAKA